MVSAGSRGERREDYLLNKMCLAPDALIWSAIAGSLAALLLPGSITIYAVLAPQPEGILATLLASTIAAMYSSCTAYMGVRWMIPSVIYALSFYYIPAALLKTIIARDPVSALSAAVDSLLLSAAGVYEEILVRGRSGILGHMLGRGREALILSALILAGAFAAAYRGYPRLGALLVAASAFILYNELKYYFNRSAWGWSSAPIWEKSLAAGLLAFHASLAALLLFLG